MSEYKGICDRTLKLRITVDDATNCQPTALQNSFLAVSLLHYTHAFALSANIGKGMCGNLYLIDKGHVEMKLFVWCPYPLVVHHLTQTVHPLSTEEMTQH